MTTSDFPQSLNFLNDAAHLLATTAPETSAYLMSHRNKLMLANDLELTDIQRQHVCTCCGHITIPGQGSSLSIETDKAVRKKPRRFQVTKWTDTKTSKRHTSPVKEFTCHNCWSKTTIKLGTPTPISRTKTKAAPVSNKSGAGATTSQADGSSLQRSEPAKASANASSKKRAKNRKGGLQALLEQSKTARSASGFGLTLETFKQK